MRRLEHTLVSHSMRLQATFRSLYSIGTMYTILITEYIMNSLDELDILLEIPFLTYLSSLDSQSAAPAPCKCNADFRLGGKIGTRKTLSCFLLNLTIELCLIFYISYYDNWSSFT